MLGAPGTLHDTAGKIGAATAAFGGILSGTEDDVQKALDRLDDYAVNVLGDTMQGALNMGGFNLSNAGTITGTTVTDGTASLTGGAWSALTGVALASGDDRPKLTIAAGITAAGTPASEAAAVTVEVLDDGEYDEDLTHVSHAHIHAPLATIKGLHTFDGTVYTKLCVRRLVNDGDAGNIFYKNAGNNTDAIFVEADEIYHDGANGDSTGGIGFFTYGEIVIHARRIVQTEGDGFTIQNVSPATVNVWFDVDYWDVGQNAATGTQGAISAVGTATVRGRVGSMIGGSSSEGVGTSFLTGALVEMSFNRLECTTAYKVQAADNTYRLIVGTLSGTETVADGAFEVGSMWWDATNRDLCLAQSVGAGAAQWDQMLNATTGGTLGGDLAMGTHDISGVGTLTASTLTDGTWSTTAGAFTGVASIATPSSITMAEDGWIGIGSGSERINFNGTAGLLLISDAHLKMAGGNQIQLGDAATYIAQDADSILALHADGYVRTGSATSSHSLGADGDLLVSGKLEVDGSTYLDGDTALVLKQPAGDWQNIDWVEGSTIASRFGVNYDWNQIEWYLGSLVGRNLVLHSTANKRYDHGTSTNPTLFIQSATDPDSDNTQWVSITHDQTNAVYSVGTGTHVFQGTTEIGEWRAAGTPSNFAMFGYAGLDQTNVDNYALTQDNSGNTYLNAADGQTLYLRTSNADRITVTASQVTFSSSLDTLHAGTAKATFQDDGTYIYSQSDSNLSVVADGSITLDALTINAGVDQGSDILYVARYSAGYSYANIQAGCTDENAGVGLLLKYRDTNGTAQPGLYLSSAGDVGIGTMTPGEILHVRSAQTARDQFDYGTIFSDSTAQAEGTGGGIAFEGKYTNAGAYVIGAGIQMKKTNGTTSNYSFDLAFHTRESGVAAQEVMRLTDVGNVGIGTTTAPHGGVGAAKLAIEGTNASTAGPHVQFTTAADDYPLMQILPFTHDNVSIVFDSFLSSSGAAWVSSDAGSNFKLTKQNDVLKFDAESGIAAGSNITWVTSFEINATGSVTMSPLANRSLFFRDTGIGIASQSDSNVTMFADGSITLDAPTVTVSDGNLYLGTADSVKGVISAYSEGGASVNGGAVVLYTAPNYDTSISYYAILANEDDLQLQAGSTAKLTYKGGEDRWDFAASAHLRSDSLGVFFGADGDASIIYDGTDLNVTTSINNASDLVLDCGTDKTLELAETVWDDINFPSGTAQLPASNIPGVVTFTDNLGADTGIATLGFAVGESLSWCLEYTHKCKEDGDAYFHVHFQCDDAPTGTDYVKWQITYTITADGETCAPATVITKEVAVDTQYEQIRADFDVLSSIGLSIGDQIKVELERIAAAGDAYAGEVKLCTFGLHVEMDTMGSRQVLVK